MAEPNPGIEGLTEFEPIGTGGFATVYSATETDIRRRVAVKILTAVDDAGRRRFDRERRTLGHTTDHTNIVTLFRSGYTNPGDQPYLVMEHLSGGSLQERLDEHGPLPWAEAVELVEPVADALSFSHGEQIVHKDVKPANILISRTGVVKLSDFGIASILETSAISAVAYSLAYTAPETFSAHTDPVSGRLIDPRGPAADFYSLAATLYALGAGRPPFINPTQAGLMNEILNTAPPSTGNPGLDEFFATAMAKEPTSRFATAEAFVSNLRAALAQPATVAHTEPDPPVAPRTVVAPVAGSTAVAPEAADPVAIPHGPEHNEEATTAGEQPRRSLVPLLALLTLAALAGAGLIAVLASRSNDGADGSGTIEDVAAGGGETDNASGPPPSAGGNDSGAGAIDGLTVCPSPLVVQLGWFPDSTSAYLFGLIDDGFAVDPDSGIITGDVVHDGGDLGLELEIRSGATFTGFAGPVELLGEDPGVHLASVSTSSQIRQWSDYPTVGVVAPLDRSPVMIMWDPQTLPSVARIEDLRSEGVDVRVFSGASFIEPLVANGVLDRDQVDTTHDGTPTALIQGERIAVQGYAPTEPYLLEFEEEVFGRAPAFQLVHDAGWQEYVEALAVRQQDVNELAPCLEAFVPLVQQAVADYAASPAAANAKVVRAVEELDTFWTVNDESMAFAAETQVELGIIASGDDGTVGSFDSERMGSLIGPMQITVPDSLRADELYTNDFIDSSISIPTRSGP